MKVSTDLLASNSSGDLKATLFIKSAFFVFGVSSISGWNAVLTALDYFQEQYTEFNVSFDFPVPVCISTCLTGLFLPKLSEYLSLTFRIAWALGIMIIMLMVIALVAKLMPNAYGFWITIGLNFWLGLLNGLQQNSCIAIASFVGGDAIKNYWIGTGFSGTIICVFRMICLAILPDNKSLGIIIYFSVAAAWNIFSIVLYLQFTKTKHYRRIINNKTTIYESATVPLQDDAMHSQVGLASNGKQHELQEITKMIEITSMNVLEIVVHVNKLIFPIPLCITLIYVQTIFMFPGMALEKNFLNEWKSWGPTLLVCTYNIGDTIGKYCSGFRRIYNKTLLIILVIARFGFFAIFYLIVVGTIEEYWVPFANLMLFSIGNGFLTGGFMQIAPEKVRDSMKEKVGFVNGFQLVLGIMLGSFLALPLQKIKVTN